MVDMISGWMMLDVLEGSIDLLTVLLSRLEHITVVMWKMLEYIVLEPHAPKEQSDFKVAQVARAVWKSAIPISGGRCAVTFGITMMHKWSAES